LYAPNRLHVKNPPAGSAPQYPPERLRLLAKQMHSLGERPLYEWMLEVSHGADPWETLEQYARLASLADFIAVHGGRDLSHHLRVAGERP
jgi:hypothetical protein